MTTIHSNILAPTELAAAEGVLRANLDQLRHWSGEPTATQVAAVTAVEGVILTATKQQAGWARLRLKALRELGRFLRNTQRQGKGRPRKKMSDADILPPTYADLGITNRHVAADALKVADIPEAVFQEYMKTDEPTLKGLLRFAEARRLGATIDPITGLAEPSPQGGKSRRSVEAAALREELAERDKRIEELEARNRELSKEVGAAGQRRRRAQAEFWLTPPHLLRQLTDEFGPFFDACPYPRPENFNSLEIPWGEKTYCNPLFLRTDQTDNEGLLAWVEKSIREAKLGKTILLPLPTRSIVNVLLESGVNLEMRSWERVGWLSTITGKPHPSPPPVTLFILRGRDTVPAAANMGLWNGNVDSIVEWLMVDPDSAAAVWRALGARLASSMSVLLLAWYGIKIPDAPLLFPARPPG
jgi:hypothetical protein